MWIDHNGKSLPDHARLADPVLVRFRDGEETRVAEPVRHWAGTASNWSWDRRHPSPSEIVAYRVVPRNIGSIAHIDHGKTSLTAAITKVLAAQKENGNEQT